MRRMLGCVKSLPHSCNWVTAELFDAWVGRTDGCAHWNPPLVRPTVETGDAPSLSYLDRPGGTTPLCSSFLPYRRRRLTPSISLFLLGSPAEMECNAAALSNGTPAFLPSSALSRSGQSNGERTQFLAHMLLLSLAVSLECLASREKSHYL